MFNYMLQGSLRVRDILNLADPRNNYCFRWLDGYWGKLRPISFTMGCEVQILLVHICINIITIISPQKSANQILAVQASCSWQIENICYLLSCRLFLSVSWSCCSRWSSSCRRSSCWCPLLISWCRSGWRSTGLASATLTTILENLIANVKVMLVFAVS